MITVEESCQMLYERIKNSPPYQPYGNWCVHDGFKPDPLIHMKKEFVPDELLNTKSKNTFNAGLV